MNQLLVTALAHKPDVVFLQVGGNDFSGSSTPDHLEVASDLVDLARRIRAAGVAHVYIGKMFRRFRSRHLPTDEAVRLYNNKVDFINLKLNEIKASIKANDIFIWQHRGMSQFAKEIIGKDGTHLNTLGMEKISTSARAALVHSKNLFTKN